MTNTITATPAQTARMALIVKDVEATGSKVKFVYRANGTIKVNEYAPGQRKIAASLILGTDGRWAA